MDLYISHHYNHHWLLNGCSRSVSVNICYAINVQIMLYFVMIALQLWRLIWVHLNVSHVELWGFLWSFSVLNRKKFNHNDMGIVGITATRRFLFERIETRELVHLFSLKTSSSSSSFGNNANMLDAQLGEPEREWEREWY